MSRPAGRPTGMTTLCVAFTGAPPVIAHTQTNKRALGARAGETVQADGKVTYISLETSTDLSRQWRDRKA